MKSTMLPRKKSVVKNKCKLASFLFCFLEIWEVTQQIYVTYSVSWNTLYFDELLVDLCLKTTCDITLRYTFLIRRKFTEKRQYENYKSVLLVFQHFKNLQVKCASTLWAADLRDHIKYNLLIESLVYVIFHKKNRENYDEVVALLIWCLLADQQATLLYHNTIKF